VFYEMDKTRNKAIIHILGWKLYDCIVSINQYVTIKSIDQVYKVISTLKVSGSRTISKRTT
jgi:uncharacterized protein (DUF1810 family)